MKEYKYEGETFLIEDTDACEIKVSDKTNSVSGHSEQRRPQRV